MITRIYNDTSDCVCLVSHCQGLSLAQLVIPVMDNVCILSHRLDRQSLRNTHLQRVFTHACLLCLSAGFDAWIQPNLAHSYAEHFLFVFQVVSPGLDRLQWSEESCHRPCQHQGSLSADMCSWKSKAEIPDGVCE